MDLLQSFRNYYVLILGCDDIIFNKKKVRPYFLKYLDWFPTPPTGVSPKHPLPEVMNISGWRMYSLYLAVLTQFSKKKFIHFFPLQKSIFFFFFSIGASICIDQEIRCLPYGGFKKNNTLYCNLVLVKWFCLIKFAKRKLDTLQISLCICKNKNFWFLLLIKCMVFLTCHGTFCPDTCLCWHKFAVPREWQLCIFSYEYANFLNYNICWSWAV